MRAAVHVGRVGGLAVALGVGFAVVTGAGVAAADTTGSDSSTKTSERTEKKRTESRTASDSATTSGSATKTTSPDTKTDTKTETDTKTKTDDKATTDADADTATPAETRTTRKASDSAKTAVRTQAATAKPVAAVQQDEPDTELAATPVTPPATQTETTAAKIVAETAAPEPVEQARPVTLETIVPPLRLVTQALSAVKLPTPAPAIPPAPKQSSLLVALMALSTRREVQARTLTAGSATAAAAAPLAAAAVVATPATTRVGWLTGANSLNDTVKRFGIAGTDVGVMWDNGILKDNPATAIVEQRQVLIAFGDTFSNPGMTGNWRNNVLFRSADNVLSNGLYVPNGIIHDPGAYSGSPMSNPNFSREIIGKYGYAVGSEVTIIPTAAVSVPGAGVNGATRQYVNFMSVRSWDSPGKWTTNYSGITYSDDNGQNWTVVPASGIRAAAAGRSTKAFIAGNQNFQQGAYVKPPAGTADATAGWVYSYGTPAGRTGTVYVSRVNDKQILDQTKYEYWNGSSWVKNKPSAATPILAGTTTSSFFGLIKKTTYPTVSEMSVQYNPYLKKYVMLYGDQNNNIVMRTSATPQSGWSAPKTLVTSAQYPGLYAPMIHPWSGSTLLKKADGTAEDPQMLYWNLSQWSEYNVALMRTDLSAV
ncbi:MAG: DUF4185 domain-containing protein [Mycobacterium sp.]